MAAASEAVSLAVDALEAAGLTGISVDFTLPDLVDTLAEKALPLAPDRIAAVRRELDMKDAGGLAEAGGEAYLPLLYAAGPFDEAIEQPGGARCGRRAREPARRACASIGEQLGEGVRVTLDPTERHGFEYQSWFGFTLYAEGARGAVGRGGHLHHSRHARSRRVGFSLYIEPLLEALGSRKPERDTLFLPIGHDREAARRLRALGWRTMRGDHRRRKIRRRWAARTGWRAASRSGSRGRATPLRRQAADVQGRCFAMMPANSSEPIRVASHACTFGMSCASNQVRSVLANWRTKGKIAMSAIPRFAPHRWVEAPRRDSRGAKDRERCRAVFLRVNVFVARRHICSGRDDA